MSRYKDATGFLIHLRAFQNNSSIVTFFSQEQGLIQLVAKGIRKNKKQKTELQYFCLLKIEYYGKSSLKTLTSIHVVRHHALNELIPKTAGLYLNEILKYGLNENETANALFDCYVSVISQLGKSKLTPLLRGFECALLKQTGFELSVDGYTDQNEWLTITEQSGLASTDKESEKLCKVGDLNLFLTNQKLIPASQKRLNKLIIKAVDICMNGRKIYSRELLKYLTVK